MATSSACGRPKPTRTAGQSSSAPAKAPLVASATACSTSARAPTLIFAADGEGGRLQHDKAVRWRGGVIEAEELFGERGCASPALSPPRRGRGRRRRSDRRRSHRRRSARPAVPSCAARAAGPRCGSDTLMRETPSARISATMSRRTVLRFGVGARWTNSVSPRERTGPGGGEDRRRHLVRRAARVAASTCTGSSCMRGSCSESVVEIESAGIARRELHEVKNFQAVSVGSLVVVSR